MKGRFLALAVALIPCSSLISPTLVSRERAAASSPPQATGAASRDLSLRVPIIVQTPERCGPAALEMVLRFYVAQAAALDEAERAYDPVLHGSLITDLAAAARRAGFEAEVMPANADSLIALLAEGVPAIVLYQNGRAPLTLPHFGVVTAWDAKRKAFTLNEGRRQPRTMSEDTLVKRWKTAGSQALVVRRRAGP